MKRRNCLNCKHSQIESLHCAEHGGRFTVDHIEACPEHSFIEYTRNNLDVLLPAVLVVAAGYAIMYGVALMCKLMLGV